MLRVLCMIHLVSRPPSEAGKTGIFVFIFGIFFFLKAWEASNLQNLSGRIEMFAWIFRSVDPPCQGPCPALGTEERSGPGLSPEDSTKGGKVQASGEQTESLPDH